MGLTENARLQSWPDEPYKGLAYYRAEDRLLFSGRQADVQECVHRLTSSETRILLLHGHTGCGKSSFLRAGLIPSAEEHSPGHHFLRDDAGVPLFIRCGPDPLTRIAEEIYRFATLPVRIVGGEDIIIREIVAEYPDLSSFVAACHKPRVLSKVLQCISVSISKTLVIILDQAEEVITLDDGEHIRKRQFFRFIKEFSSSNFPIKLVIALRSDYSGQFIELGQTAGSIDLRGPMTEGGPEHSREIRPDIKLFLLRELGKAEVTEAIELPTSSRTEDGNPFEVYTFSYAQGVAKEIANDLFSASATSVLPAMQLTCRDLYNNMPPDRRISMQQYIDGGRITGPVDRHVSSSLRKSFANANLNDTRPEERKWREVLCQFVHGESDGTVRTRVIGLLQLRDIARQLGVTANVDDVVAHLKEPDVLLLRSVPSSISSNEGMAYSLGHDFIGMVLHQWKSVAEERARVEKIKRRAVAYSFAAVAAFAILVSIFVYAKVLGIKSEIYQVLVMRARHLEREESPVSMLNAAQAMIIARQYRFLNIDDREAASILARTIAGRPQLDSTISPSAADNAPDQSAAVVVLPLPRSNGFVRIQNNHVLISRNVGARPFELASMPEHAAAFTAPVQYSVSETDAGTAMLLLTSSAVSLKGEPEIFYQLYVIPVSGEIKPPLDAGYFLAKTDSPWNEPQSSRAYSAPVTAAMELRDGVVTISALKLVGGKGPLWLRTFVYDEKSLEFDTAPSRLNGINVNLENAAGLLRPMRVGAYMVVPEASIEGSNTPNLVRYALLADKLTHDSLAGIKDVPCPHDCSWRWIGNSDTGGTMLFFAAPLAVPNNVPSQSMKASSDKSYAQISAPGLNKIAGLLIVDVALQKKFLVNVDQLTQAKTSCNSEQGANSPNAPAAANATGDSMFLMDRHGLPLVGLINGHSADLIEINASGGATCLGTILFGEDIAQWASTRDGNYLLGSGPHAALRWDLKVPISQRVSELSGQEKLIDHACDSDLKRMIVDFRADDWLKKTGVPDLPPELSSGLCKG